jgi:methionyl-tRNA formyltransferase
MKIILFTQEDPFYIVDSTKDLIQKIKKDEKHSLVQAIITPPSPFGRRETFKQKAMKTYRIFGFGFFLHYSYKFFLRKIILKKSVEKVLKEYNVPVISISDTINSKKNVDFIKSLEADLILIIAGNQIIKKRVLDSTKYGVFNVHSSLLPNYKGLMPTFWVLKNQESKTGVTLYQLTEGIDDGPIIASKEFKLTPQITQSKLIKELKILANDLVIESIEMVMDNNNYKKLKDGSYFKFPTNKDVKEFKLNKQKFY